MTERAVIAVYLRPESSLLTLNSLIVLGSACCNLAAEQKCHLYRQRHSSFEKVTADNADISIFIMTKTKMRTHL